MTKANISGCSQPELNGEHDVLAVPNVVEVVPTETLRSTEVVKKPADIFSKWDEVVTAVIRRARGLKPEEEVVLPQGETGHYVKYALDSAGRLSLGKGHGRRRIRWTSWKAQVARLQNQLFAAGLTAAFKRAKLEADKASTSENKVDVAPLTQEKVNEIQQWAADKALELAYEPSKQAAKSARLRHRLARRVNFGLVPGNQARPTHSGN